MEKITDLEELKKIIKSRWGWVNDKDLTEDAKRYIILKTNDDLYIFIDTKPSITKDIYYDDEQDAPELTEELFINVNLRYNFRYNLDAWYKQKYDLETIGCCLGSYSEKMYIESYSKYENYINAMKYENHKVYRYLDEEEQNFIIQLYEKLKQIYIERLKKYYKRYNKNIACIGYWANR